MKTVQSSALIKSLIVILLISIISACSSTNSTSPNREKAETEKKPPTSSTSKVVIPFWITPQGKDITAWFTKWTNEFNKENDRIEVKLEFVPQDAWQQKLKAAQANGTAPQISWTNYASIPGSAEQGIYAPLDDYLAPELFDDIYDNIREIVKVGDKHYSYPVFVEPYEMLFYRTDFFEEVGLDPQQPPKSWDELIEVAGKLTKSGRFGLAVPGSSEIGWTHWSFQNMIGHYPISDDWSKATVNDDDYRQLFNFWKRLYDEKVVPKQALSESWNIKPLAEGRVAMMYNGSWSIGDLRNDYKDVADKVAVAVAPTPDGVTEGRTTAALGGYALTLDGKAKNPKEAAEFIKYLVADKPEIMKDFFETSQYSKFSARKSVDELIGQDPRVAEDPYRKLVVEKVIPFAKPEPWYSYDISSIYGTALETVVANGVNVDDALAKLEKDINDYIKVHNYANKNPKNK